MILEGKKAQEEYNKIKADNRILLESIVGSHSYGLNIETSDIDKKFIFIDSLENVLTGNTIEQLNITDDYVGYEIGRFLDLLRTQNPNLMELLWEDEKNIITCNDLFRKLVIDKRELLLSKAVLYSYGSYAHSQIKKAQSTNKKWTNPMDGPRKSLLEFAWVPYNQGSISLLDYLKLKHIPVSACGLVAIDHMKYTYHLFVDDVYSSRLKLLTKKYNTLTKKITRFIDKKILRKEESFSEWLFQTEINTLQIEFQHIPKKYKGLIDKDGVQPVLSSTKKNDTSIIIVHFNLDGFSKYCKDYKEYQEWLEKRNLGRFAENQDNEHKYDRKNMMHCHRLLNMCIEILAGKGVQVLRKDREKLLNIRFGKFTYQDLVSLANRKLKVIEWLYNRSELPEKVNKKEIDEILLEFRKSFYL